MLTERASTRSFGIVVRLDVVSFRALRVVVMHGFSDTRRVPRINLWHFLKPPVPVERWFQSTSSGSQNLEEGNLGPAVHSSTNPRRFRLSPPI